MRSEAMFVNLHRKIVLVLLKPEAARHAAAAVVEYFSPRAHGFEESFFGVQGDDCFLVTVPLNYDVLIQAGWLVIVLCQEFGQGKHLAGESLCILVMRPKIEHFVPKDGKTTRLQTHDR